jgi:hypothetical protein
VKLRLQVLRTGRQNLIVAARRLNSEATSKDGSRVAAIPHTAIVRCQYCGIVIMGRLLLMLMVVVIHSLIQIDSSKVSAERALRVVVRHLRRHHQLVAVEFLCRSLKQGLRP